MTDSVTTPLGTLVSTRLAEHQVDEDSLDWDSWLVDQGRWMVRLTYRTDGDERAATWPYDPGRRSIEPADDEARWLTDEERAASRPHQQRAPRLAAVPAHEPDEEVGRHDTVPIDSTVPIESRRRPRAVPDPDPESTLDDADVEETDIEEPHAHDDETAPSAPTRWTSRWPPTPSGPRAGAGR